MEESPCLSYLESPTTNASSTKIELVNNSTFSSHSQNILQKETISSMSIDADLANPLVVMAKNSLSITNVKGMMLAIASYYIENASNSTQWTDYTKHFFQTYPSKSIHRDLKRKSCADSNLFLSKNDYISSILAIHNNSDISSKASITYFSSLPAFLDEDIKFKSEPHGSSFVTNYASSEALSLDQPMSSIREDESFVSVILKCKNDIGMDFQFAKYFPSSDDLNDFKASRNSAKRIRMAVDKAKLASIEPSLELEARNFYVPLPCLNSDSSTLQPFRGKYPYFINQKDTSLNRTSLRSVLVGDIFMDVWYSAPFPSEYVPYNHTIIWICPWCLKYCGLALSSERHKLKCCFNRPPGKEVHRQKLTKNKILSIFEVDGSRHVLFCQNLCLLAKCFLDHKILYYDVNSFLFYVLTEYSIDDTTGKSVIRIVGYFSKERNVDVNNNVSCIVIFPAYQGLGYGQYLIDFSYLLTKDEGLVGGPETPLSDLGFLSYAKYWMDVAVLELQDYISSKKEQRLTWNGMR